MPRRLVALVAAALLGCSSIPDVVFEDANGGTSSGTSGGVPGDGASGTSSGGVRCPDRPPPASEGRCCGAHICVGCNEPQCDRCGADACQDGDACIARGNGNNVECRR